MKTDELKLLAESAKALLQIAETGSHAGIDFRSHKNKEWVPFDNCSGDVSYNVHEWHFRIRPQPRVIPWTRETVKRDAWLRFKGSVGSATDWPINGISYDSINVNGIWLTYENALERLIQIDGLPAGTVEEVRE